jgi:hypothetical protein
MDEPTLSSTEFLMIRRAYAIDAYARVEQSLCGLFGHVMGTTRELAVIVFYRITNTHSRNRIIEELIEKRYGDAYNAYLNGIPNTPHRSGLLSIIRQLDQKRNEIVHWHMGLTFRVPQRVGPSLMKPDTHPFTLDPNHPIITSDEMIDFSRKAYFVSRSVNGLLWFLQNKTADDPACATWQEIFAQPASYPPPDNHLLSRNHVEPESPPPPSGG